MPRYRITISSSSGQAMADLVLVHKIEVFDHGARRNVQGVYSVDAIVQQDDIQRIQNAGYSVQQHEDIDEMGKLRQKEVGQGNRYENSLTS